MDSTAFGMLNSKLMQFSLTRQEATIYLCLMQNKELSGYEVSKITGISRSNVYSALAGLVEKGAAYLIEGSTNKYTAVPAEEFCQNKIRRLNQLKQEIVHELPKINTDNEGYITISSHRHIMDKIATMLENVAYRVYISMPPEYLMQFWKQLEQLGAAGKKVVLLVESTLEKTPKDSIVYITHKTDRQLKLIVDSEYVLTGEMTGAETDTCLYCAQQNFVNVFKESLKNEIRLIELTGSI